MVKELGSLIVGRFRWGKIREEMARLAKYGSKYIQACGHSIQRERGERASM